MTSMIFLTLLNSYYRRNDDIQVQLYLSPMVSNLFIYPLKKARVYPKTVDVNHKSSGVKKIAVIIS